ncbi:neuropeptide SIFamide receptor isoform X2 [Procambarus clarkii]|uniref:neuropeptide SIFamide receptor isoform X2 n=1 Tax=Procambarus clarkii TaxID=6728 RepID=UPI001E671DE9|nr:neuropeptide SIFamide receptor-like isoform X2 [Procambarus clarkii]
MYSQDVNTTARTTPTEYYYYSNPNHYYDTLDDNTTTCPPNGTEMSDLCVEYEVPTFRHSLSVTILYCVAYVFVSVMGVIGNSFVVAVVMRAPRMRTVTNVFIANLAVADLLVNIIVMPTTLIGHLLNAWVLGLFVCKAMSYLQGVSVSASINTLVAISVDRALAICYPMRCQITSRTCRSIIVVIWAFSLTITLPWAIFFKLEPIPDTDLHVWRRKLPGEQQDVGVAMMIHRSKIKVIKMLLVVVILFALSWLPLYAIFARLKLGVVLTEMETQVIHVLAPIAQWLGASNSCINPILYAFFNDKFRSGFKAILVSRSCCSPLRLDNNCKTFHSVRAQNLCSLESKASSEFSVYSSSSGSAETRHKSVLVQVPVESRGARAVVSTTAAAERKRPVVTQRSKTSMVLYRQCIINNLTNGAASSSSNTPTTITTTTAATTTTATQVNGCTTLV